MSSAICFDLDQSKILSSGNRLKDKKGLKVVHMALVYYHTKRFWTLEIKIGLQDMRSLVLIYTVHK